MRPNNRKEWGLNKYQKVHFHSRVLSDSKCFGLLKYVCLVAEMLGYS